MTRFYWLDVTLKFEPKWLGQDCHHKDYLALSLGLVPARV